MKRQKIVVVLLACLLVFSFMQVTFAGKEIVTKGLPYPLPQYPTGCCRYRQFPSQ